MGLRANMSESLLFDVASDTPSKENTYEFMRSLITDLG